MAFFSNLFSKASPPLIKVSATEGISFAYSNDLDIFYQTYEQNAYVEMCVARLSKDTGKYGYAIKRGKFDQPKTLLSDLTKYSIDMMPKEFFKRIIRDYSVAGNVYVYVARDKSSGATLGLQILDPRYMKPIVNQSGQILGYFQNLEGIRAFTKDEVYHLRYDSDLKNEAIGRSRIQSLFLDLETDKEARESNWAFFRNNQTPSSIVVMDEGFSTENVEAMDKIKSLFQGGTNQGGKNKHRTSLVQGIKTILKIQDKMEDGQFMNLRKATWDLVCAAFDVPKDILGITDSSNRSVGESQADNYWDTIEGLETLLGEFLSKILQDVYKVPYTLEFIQDNTRKLTKRANIATELYEKGLITRNEGREIVQYEKIEGEDAFFEKPATVSTVDQKPADKKLSK